MSHCNNKRAFLGFFAENGVVMINDASLLSLAVFMVVVGDLRMVLLSVSLLSMTTKLDTNLVVMMVVMM